MTVDYLRANGSRLAYRFDGPANAPVLLLSNSLGTSLEMWDGQIPVLGQSHRVLRYDSRGHGRSEAPPGPYTVAQMGQDVVALLEGLRLARVAVCGLSLGGMVGMWLGVNAVERIDRLVLCNTAPHIGSAELWNARIAKVEAEGMAGIVETLLERWFTARFRAAHPEAVERARQMLVTTAPGGYVAACAAVRDMDQREAIAAIACPTLVIAGTEDAVTPPAEGRALAARIALARYAELPAAHLSNIESEARFNAVVADFLTGSV